MKRPMTCAMLAISAIISGLTLRAAGQLEVGETSLTLSGNVQIGYTGDYSNVNPSDHSFTPGGNADLSGYYYNPAFISFNAQTFYNQSRFNSTEQSVFQTTGFAGSAAFFGGSHFPGSITFNKVFNTEGQYTLPGAGSLTTRGNNQNLGINWGLYLPEFPQISVHFSDGDSENSLLGSSENSTANVKTVGVQVSHKLYGFNLNGGYQYNRSHEVVPDLASGQEAEALVSDSSTNAFNVDAAHKLPLRGSFEVAYGRNDLNANYLDTDYTGTVNTVSASAGIMPIQKLSVSVNTVYTDNLSASLYQPLVTSGAVVPASAMNYATNALSISGQQTYSIGNMITNLNLVAIETRQQQTVLGESISTNTFSQMLNYSRPVFGGYMNATGSISENVSEVGANSTTIGTYENLSYTRSLQGWQVNASGNYSRMMQTALVGYTSSGYGYSAAISRKFGSTKFWDAVVSGNQIQYNNANVAGSFSQTYSTSFSVRNYGVSGSFSKSSGNAILTPTGVVTSPIPIPEAMFLRGDSYAASVFANPIHGMLVSANWVRSLNDTFGDSTAFRNSNGQLVIQVQEKLRQMWLQGGYFRLNQAISATGQPPIMTGSFYIGVSRWFNFF